MCKAEERIEHQEVPKLMAFQLPLSASQVPCWGLHHPLSCHDRIFKQIVYEVLYKSKKKINNKLQEHSKSTISTKHLDAPILKDEIEHTCSFACDSSFCLLHLHCAPTPMPVAYFCTPVSSWHGRWPANTMNLISESRRKTQMHEIMPSASLELKSKYPTNWIMVLFSTKKEFLVFEC